MTLTFDMNINRDYLLLKDYLPTKFEASGVKRPSVISCTMCKRPTDIPTNHPVGIPGFKMRITSQPTTLLISGRDVEN